MSPFLIFIFVSKLISTKISAQCVINPDCMCVLKSSQYDLTCEKTNKTLAEFPIFKFNPNYDYNILIQNKNYSSLSNYIFKGIRLLKVLMNDNEIEFVPDRAFSNINKINSLELYNNRIKSLDNIIISLSNSSTKPVLFLDTLELID